MRVRVVVAVLLVAASAACSLAAPDTASPSVAPVVTPLAPAATVPGWASEGVGAMIVIAGPMTSITADETGVWVRIGYGDIARVDPTLNAAVALISPGFTQYGHVRVGAGAVWSTDFDHNAVFRIDAETNEIVDEIAVGQNPEGLTVTDDTVWVSNHRDGSISRVDPATNTVVATLIVGPEGPSGPKEIVIAGGDLWTSIPNIGAVRRIDPDSGAVVQSFPVSDPGDILTDGEFVYAYAPDTFLKIDVGTNAVTALETPAHLPIAFADGAAWAVDGTELWRLDPTSFEPTESWQIAESEISGAQLAFTAGTVWVANGGGEVVRVNLDN